jgi:hypothetical protein
MKRATVVVVVGSFLFWGCGGDDGGAGTGTCVDLVEFEMDGTDSMVLLSSLGIDLPFDLQFDAPVPADVTLIAAAATEDRSGVEVRLETAATLAEVDGYYRSAFQMCPESSRSADLSSGAVWWSGTNDGTNWFRIYLDDFVLGIVEEQQ